MYQWMFVGFSILILFFVVWEDNSVQWNVERASEKLEFQMIHESQLGQISSVESQNLEDFPENSSQLYDFVIHLPKISSFREKLLLNDTFNSLLKQLTNFQKNHILQEIFLRENDDFNYVDSSINPQVDPEAPPNLLYPSLSRKNPSFHFYEFSQKIDPFDQKLKISRKRLPNVIGLGCKKCGTTALMSFLNFHKKFKAASSQLLTKNLGEPHFFDEFYPHYNKSIKFYKNMFPYTFSDDVVFEKSPSYIASSLAAQSIYKMYSYLDEFNSEEKVKNLKFLVVLCDPVKRSYSDFTHMMNLVRPKVNVEFNLEVKRQLFCNLRTW